jgi:uncharacterized cofD-like protein
MSNLPLHQFNQVVAIGGGHGLGRVLSSLSFLGPKLTGIVTTTDNGGSTGRLRAERNCIAWGDLRNCLTQLANRPSLGSLLFEYRFDGDTELGGHNLGNLILLALDQLCVRPLEAVNLIRGLLKIESHLIPMSEEPTHLVAIGANGNKAIGELDVDSMQAPPVAMALEPLVPATHEALEAVSRADLIILGPGSFLTSILPPLLLHQLGEALARSQARVLLIDNIDPEYSAAAQFSIDDKVEWLSRIVGRDVIDCIIRHGDPILSQGRQLFYPMASKHSSGLHDREALADAISLAVSSQTVSQ